MRWNFKPKPDPLKTRQLATALNVNTHVAGLLVQRGVEDYEQARAFFSGGAGFRAPGKVSESNHDS